MSIESRYGNNESKYLKGATTAAITIIMIIYSM